MVISAKNPIHSVLYLIIAFCNVSCLLILLEVEFLALIFIIVYVGAIAVLFLFVVMMLNVKISELTESSLRYLPVGGLLGVIFLCEIGLVVGNDLVPSMSALSRSALIADLHLLGCSKVCWNLFLETSSNVHLFGLVIYTNFVYLFLVASLILLVSMVGAIVLTLCKRVNVKKQDIFKQVSTNFEKVVYNCT